ncbi:tetratricopeptide repeat protein [Tabrizicola sp.]|uniref:tetratricopeptide repeat protein n=1 Tax=Tabrizicola sp. TaxID=2005166 RepID=UPI00286A88BC|nr:tetratricopeptide repeat protein [Tabrizicola sp.]
MFIRLVGVFEVRDDLGRDCTPRGAKARAILAMLCQTPDRRRARRWLEARLWSDRGAEQASGSLRQALMEIRKALGAEADRLEADRDSVRISGVVTDLEQDRDAAAQALQSGREFLEGIDIIDQAFEDWLREETARVESQMGTIRPTLARVPMAHTARLPFVIRLGRLPEGLGSFVGMALADAIGRLVSEFAHIDLYGSGGMPIPVDLPREGMALHVEGAEIQDRVHVLISLSSIASGQIIWNQRAAVPAADTDLIGAGDLPPLVYQAADAALSYFPRMQECAEGPRRANALIARSLTEMFSYDGARLRAADQLLIEAGEIASSARIYAWRCLVRQIMIVERTETDYTRLIAETDEYSRKALELSKANPLVLSLVGLSRVIVDENPEAGSVLARDALEMSPHNAHCHLAQAIALSRTGDNVAALDVARRGAEIAARTAHVHWWEAASGLVALRSEQYAAAIAHYEAAHYRAPSFRAAMRHLLFLYLWAGKRDKAAVVLKGLLRVEPDFTLDRIMHEPNYPAVSLRRSGLMTRFGDQLKDL